MKCAEYRQAGLAITTSHVESTIKRLNQRVKGTEKFWSEPGAEAILQLRADTLSETSPLEEFWVRRAGQATGERRQRSHSDTTAIAVSFQTVSYTRRMSSAEPEFTSTASARRHHRRAGHR